MALDYKLILATINSAPDPEATLQALIQQERENAAYRAKNKNGHGCGWCCVGVPFEQRGEMHKKTCRPA